MLLRMEVVSLNQGFMGDEELKIWAPLTNLSVPTYFELILTNL